jgi:small subunit ribosomal protein S6
MQHEYETIYVARPDLDEAETKRITEKIEGVITKGGGSIFVNEDWGKRKMAYLIRKHTQGHYIYLNYAGSAELPSEVERNLGIEDNLLRYLTVRLAENIDLEKHRVDAIERQRKRVEKMTQQLEEEEEIDDDRLSGRGDREGPRDGDIEDDE